MGRRTAATGSLLPQGGLVQPGCTPHFSFVVPKEKRAVHGPKRKAFDALRCSGPPRDGGRRISACSDLGRPSGTLCSSAIPVVTDPWRMVRRLSGWLTHGPASIFAAAGCSVRERERQRKEEQDVSLYFPGPKASPRAGRFRP